MSERTANIAPFSIPSGFKERSFDFRLFGCLLVVAMSCRVPVVLIDTSDGNHIAGIILLAVFLVTFVLNPPTASLALPLIATLFAFDASDTRLLKASIQLPSGGELYVVDTLFLLLPCYWLYRCLVGWAPLLSRYIRENWVAILATFLLLLWKLMESGINEDSIRNCAIFLYSLTIPMLAVGALGSIRGQSIPLLKGALVTLGWMSVVRWLALILVLGGLSRVVLVPLRSEGVLFNGIFNVFPTGSLLLFAACGAAIVPATFIKIRHKLVIFAFFAFDAVTYLDRAMWVSVAAAVTLEFTSRFRYRHVQLALFAVLAVLLIGNADTLREASAGQHTGSSEWRWLAWALTAQGIAERPLLGHPVAENLLGSFGTNSDTVNQQIESGLMLSADARFPHNSYLTLGYFGGLIGAAFVLFFPLKVLYKFWRLNSASAQLTAIDRELVRGTYRGLIAAYCYSSFNVVLETAIEGAGFWLIVVVAWTMLLRLESRGCRFAPSAPRTRVLRHR